MRSDPLAPAGADAPATPSTSPLPLSTWEALPLAVRASDRLAGMLLALDDIETDLSSPDAEIRCRIRHSGSLESPAEIVEPMGRRNS